jgi:dephospho-CoA kinase
MNKLTVGLTGGIGSGKSTVAKFFQKLHIDIIDADEIAKEVVLPGSHLLGKIAQELGGTILTKDGSLDRSALKTLIFEKPEIKNWLEDILHPAIRKQMAEEIDHCKSKYIILAIPLLIETLPNELVKRILVVDCAESAQIERAIERDHMPRELVQRIIETQASRDERLLYADDVIENDSDLASLEDQVLRLHQFYQDIA